MLAVTSITFFFVVGVKCGLYEINQINRANATHGPNRNNIGPERSGTRTCICTDANNDSTNISVRETKTV